MPDEHDASLTVAAAVLGIALQPEWAAAVRFHLELSLRLAQMVAEFPLPDDAEPAPVFRA